MDRTNPKDLIGIRKVQLGLLPAAAKIYGALAMEDGAKKYGPYNWRDKHVRMTIYLDALERHLLALRDGENDATDSLKPHLGHIIACAGILADAVEGGFLIDDRPLPGPAPALLARLTKPLEPAPAPPSGKARSRARRKGRATSPPAVQRAR